MATPVAEVVKVNWKQLFPWLALFRAPGLALHVRQIFVGVVAAGLIELGHSILLGSYQPRRLRHMTLFSEDFLVWIWAPLLDLIWPLLPVSTDLSAGEEFVWWQRPARVIGAMI